MVQAWGAPHLSLAPWGCLDTLLQASVGMGANARLIPDFGAGIYGGDVLQLTVLTAQLGSLMCWVLGKTAEFVLQMTGPSPGTPVPHSWCCLSCPAKITPLKAIPLQKKIILTTLPASLWPRFAAPKLLQQHPMLTPCPPQPQGAELFLPHTSTMK